MVVEEVWIIMVEFGFCMIDEMVGCVDVFLVDEVIDYWKV